MKKWILRAVPPIVIIVVGSYLAFRRKADYDAHQYSIYEQLNVRKTGTIIECGVGPDDANYLFVRDFKKSPSKPQFLCYMNYTST